jgi:hypothetical protein
MVVSEFSTKYRMKGADSQSMVKKERRRPRVWRTRNSRPSTQRMPRQARAMVGPPKRPGRYSMKVMAMKMPPRK